MNDHWMKLRLDESVSGWGSFWMKLSPAFQTPPKFHEQTDPAGEEEKKMAQPFGHGQLWPNQLKPTSTCVCVFVCVLCVFVCVCLCVCMCLCVCVCLCVLVPPLPPDRPLPDCPGASGPLGLHDNPRIPNVHISVSQRFKHHQNSTRRPPKRETKKSENCGGRGKKARNFGLHPSGPPLLGSTLRGPTRGPNLRAPTFSGFGPFILRGLHPSGPHLRRHVGLKRHWPEQVRPKQVKPKQVGSDRFRPRPLQPNWPEQVRDLFRLKQVRPV